MVIKRGCAEREGRRLTWKAGRVDLGDWALAAKYGGDCGKANGRVMWEVMALGETEGESAEI